MPDSASSDLVVLTPGKDETMAIRGVLARHRSIGIRPIEAVFLQHPDHDAGCRLRAHEFLRPQTARFQHALVIFDLDGCGSEQSSQEELEAEVAQRLSAAGWADRAAVVVIDPELEIWIWDNSSHVDDALGWRGRDPTLRQWLVQAEFMSESDRKPKRPKEAMEQALQIVGKRRSSAIYGTLAEKVGLNRCTDPAFVRLKTTLQQWFPKPSR